MSAPAGAATIHASAVAIGAHGVLIRGAAGSGKSALALALIEDARGDTTLIGDDRVRLTRRELSVEAAPAEALAGLIELRGVGILRRPYRERATLSLIVDLLPLAECPRLPEAAERVASLEGVALPRLCVAAGAADAALRVRVALREWLE